MAKSLLDLSKRLRQIANDVDEKASLQSVEIAKSILAELIISTPVDESTALSNWQVSLGQSTDSKIPAYFKGKFGSTWNASMQAAYAAGVNVLHAKKPGVTIWLTNNQPYIRRLNEGYSAQAPAGFVEKSIKAGKKKAKRIKPI